MFTSKLSDIGEQLGAVASEGAHLNATVTQVSTDSRQPQEGQLFFALTGERFDGHDFLGDAQAQGALAAVVSQFMPVDMPQLKVADTLQAMHRLAAGARRRFAGPVVAITGSCGKTTTKALVSSIMQQKWTVLASQKSFNNHYGVPLTLLDLNETTQAMVQEIGANEVGEIGPLAQLVQPTIAVITNAGPAHLAGFGDVAGVAREKGQLLSGLGSKGVAVLNALDDHFSDWSGMLGGRDCLSFGVTPCADVAASAVVIDEQGYSRFTLHTPNGQAEVRLPLCGRHHVENALAAAAASSAAGVSFEAVVEGLQQAKAESSRMEVKAGWQGASVIDDCYNANPKSTEAALQVLARHKGKKIWVFADMVEMGPKGPELHAYMGQRARQLGVNQLLACGELVRETVNSFGTGAEHFEALDDLVAALKPRLDPNCMVLVKGSRSARLERVVAELAL